MTEAGQWSRCILATKHVQRPLSEQAQHRRVQIALIPALHSANVEGRTKPCQAPKDHAAVLYQGRDNDGGYGNLYQHAVRSSTRLRQLWEGG